MIPIVLAITAVVEADLGAAQRLYEDARYEQALEALGAECSPSDGVVCEQLRGFILVALGREADAHAAFGRLLVAAPDTSLGPDVSPKLQALFAAVKREVLLASSLELSPVRLASAVAPGVVKMLAPDAIEVASVTAHVASPSREIFEQVDLVREGDAFVGAVDFAMPSSDVARYFLTVKLGTGVEVLSGSELSPRELRVTVTGGGETAGPGGGGSPFDGVSVGGVEPADSAGLPSWAVWTIVGGVAVAVAGGVAAVLLVMTRDDPGPGTVQVDIQFPEEP